MNGPLMAALPEPAATALWVFTAWAGLHDSEPTFQQDARLNILLAEVMHAHGCWADVVALIALDEPALDFLDPYAARTVWTVLGGTFPLFDESSAAA